MAPSFCGMWWSILISAQFFQYNSKRKIIPFSDSVSASASSIQPGGIHFQFPLLRRKPTCFLVISSKTYIVDTYLLYLQKHTLSFGSQMSSSLLWYLFDISETRISVKSLDFKLADKRKAFSSLTRLHTYPLQWQRKLVKKYIWRWKVIRIRGIRENISTRKMVMIIIINENPFELFWLFVWFLLVFLYCGVPRGKQQTGAGNEY